MQTDSKNIRADEKKPLVIKKKKTDKRPVKPVKN
jgi:hypothetical protein